MLVIDLEATFLFDLGEQGRNKLASEELDRLWSNLLIWVWIR